MAGYGKRVAAYVPSVMRGELDKLTKADLMEVAYDLALMNVGSESDELGAYRAMCDSARAIAASQGRTVPKLAADFRTIARQALADLERHAQRFAASASERQRQSWQDVRDYWQPYADGAR